MKRKRTRYYLSDGETWLSASQLRRASRDTKLDAMCTWFHANYEDPAESTPYESAEGGYIYIWGGPYDPEEELQDEFGQFMPEDLIEQLAEELRDICWEWTRHPEYDDRDIFFESIAASTEHEKTFSEAIANVEHLLSLKVKSTYKTHLLRLLYVNVITAVETYLSDVFISSVGKDQGLLKKFVETTPEFKTEKIAVADVFKAVEDIEKRARAYLVDVVWHHLGRVKPMFKATLGVSFSEEMDGLFKAVIVRHDLVHRNGKTKDEEQHDISPKMVRKLIEHAKEFVSHVDKQLADKAAGHNGFPDGPSDVDDF